MNSKILLFLALFVVALSMPTHAYISYDSNHKAVYQLENLLGTDTSGNGYTQTISSGNITTGIENNGILDIRSTSASGIADFNSTQFTIEAWVNLTASGAYVLVVKPLVTGDSSPQFSLVAGGSIWEAGRSDGFEFCIRNGANTSFYCADYQMTVNLNEWYYVAGIYNGTDVMLYVNGSLLETTPAPDYYMAEMPVCLGERCQGDIGLSGSMDEVYYSNIARDQTYLQNVYDTYTALPPKAVQGATATIMLIFPVLLALGILFFLAKSITTGKSQNLGQLVGLSILAIILLTIVFVLVSGVA